MNSWTKRFFEDHGDRLVFMLIATVFGVYFLMVVDMAGEGKTLLIAVATLALNKARSKHNGGENSGKEKGP